MTRLRWTLRTGHPAIAAGAAIDLAALAGDGVDVTVEGVVVELEGPAGPVACAVREYAMHAAVLGLEVPIGPVAQVGEA